MSFRLVVPKKAQKEIDQVDIRFRDRIIAALRSLEVNPYIGKKLRGEYRDQWSYNVWPYRIIYKIYKNELVVLIVRIGHRQGVY